MRNKEKRKNFNQKAIYSTVSAKTICCRTARPNGHGRMSCTWFTATTIKTEKAPRIKLSNMQGLTKHGSDKAMIQNQNESFMPKCYNRIHFGGVDRGI